MHPNQYCFRLSTAFLEVECTCSVVTDLTHDCFKNIILLIMPSNRPNFQQVEGILIPPFFSKECFQSALRFQPKSGDVFIVTYPKCGTTWMQNVVINILRRGKPLDHPCDFFLASPFLDQLGAEDSERMMIRPGAYKTHLPFHKVPWSDEAKYIYVARNPKDCCVSYYHHLHQIPGYQFGKATIAEYFDLFLAGDIDYNDYFDHLLSWYNERDRQNVFFTTYEEMKSNLKEVVRKVAKFISEDDAQYLESNPHILDKILQSCSFEEMKFINRELNNMYDVDAILADPKIPKGRKHIAAYNASLPKGPVEYIDFIRKGNIGDWKTVLGPNQNERLNNKIRLITKFSDVMTLWENVLW